MQTPWGKSQHSKQYGKGITFYGTAGHGGFKVSAALNQQIPDYMRAADGYADGNAGWYEEDCAWSLVVTIFPERFEETTVISAKETLRNTYPAQYERFYGVTLKPGESHNRDSEVFHAEHANDYLVLSAFGDWHKDVAKGFVGVFAGKGGRTKQGHYPDQTKWFLVPDAEYKPGMVLDPGKYAEMAPIS
jgi:hypothetical protein